MDLTAPSAGLARAAADLVRLLPGRLTDPVLNAVVLTASCDGVELAGTDRERSVRLSAPARVHEDGAVLVPSRPLAETLRLLDAEEVRLVVEGRRLAIRTPGARFALPMLDQDLHPGVLTPPPRVGVIDAPALRRAAVVASAASRDDALPMFTGVHVRQRGDRLVFVGTDRFRMAIASVPWRSDVDGLDVLVPAALLTEVAKQATGEVALHADADRAGFGGPVEVSTSVLDAVFPDESRYLTPAADCTVEVPADELAGALRRVGPYAGGHGSVHLIVGDGELRVRAGDPQLGDAEETVKADVSGDRIELAFQPRYLADALHPFAGRQARLSLRAGTRRSSVVTSPATDPHDVDLHYVVMPRQA